MFTMSKFNKEQKIEIYHKWKDENISISQLAKAYRMNLANLDYMLRLIDMHGIEILTTKNQRYSAAERRKLAITYCERIRKKTKCLGSRRSEEIARVITDLRQEFKVSLNYVLAAIAE